MISKALLEVAIILMKQTNNTIRISHQSHQSHPSQHQEAQEERDTFLFYDTKLHDQ